LAVEISESLRARAFSFGKRLARDGDAKGHDVRGVEAETDALQPRQTSDKQSPAYKQHERERDFEDDQHSARAIRPRAAACAAPALLERFAHAGAGDSQGGREAEERPSHERNERREDQRARIETRLRNARDAFGA